MVRKAPMPPEQDAVASIPETTPSPGFGAREHSFTLQAIMELQKSMGELNATVNGMKSTLDSVKIKVDGLVAWKHAIVGGAITLGVVVTVLVFLLSRASDFVTFKTPPVAPAAVAPVPTPAPTAAAPTPK